MKKNARPSSDRTADGDRDREIRLIVVDAPRAASGEPAGVRATPVIIFLVVARGSSRSQIFIVSRPIASLLADPRRRAPRNGGAVGR
jgi:hypothetical protein